VALLGEIAQMAAHGVLGGLQFGREFGGEDPAVRAQPLQDQRLALFGHEPVARFLAGSLHGLASLFKMNRS
jgi:hypothetical protein